MDIWDRLRDQASTGPGDLLTLVLEVMDPWDAGVVELPVRRHSNHASGTISWPSARMMLKRAAAQPNGGRLGADVAGFVLGAIASV